MSATLAAGLTVRPLEETARDTLRWLERTGGPITGLTAAEEATLLAARHAERGYRPSGPYPARNTRTASATQ